jgi:hypothetical protein
MSCPSQSSWLDHPNDIWWGLQSIMLFVMQSSDRIDTDNNLLWTRFFLGLSQKLLTRAVHKYWSEWNTIQVTFYRFHGCGLSRCRPFHFSSASPYPDRPMAYKVVPLQYDMRFVFPKAGVKRPERGWWNISQVQITQHDILHVGWGCWGEYLGLRGMG